MSAALAYDLESLNELVNAAIREPLPPESPAVTGWRVVGAIDQRFGLLPIGANLRGWAEAMAAREEPAAPAPTPAPANDDTPEIVPCDLSNDLAPVRHLENPRPRRSLARDRRSTKKSTPYYVEELARRGRVSVRAPLPSLHPSQTPSHTPSSKMENTLSPSMKKAKAEENDRRGIASWKETGELGRLVAMNRALTLNDAAEGYAWTLNLSPAVIARALASRHSGFASFMQKRIAAELARLLPRPIEFVFAVDVTRAGRPHLHGMVACNDNERPAVEVALRRAGGAWKAACADRQVDTRLAWNADGWTRYSARNLAAARKVVGPSVIAGTSTLKAEAKALHERLRRMSLAAA